MIRYRAGWILLYIAAAGLRASISSSRFSCLLNFDSRIFSCLSSYFLVRAAQSSAVQSVCAAWNASSRALLSTAFSSGVKRAHLSLLSLIFWAFFDFALAFVSAFLCCLCKTADSPGVCGMPACLATETDSACRSCNTLAKYERSPCVCLGPLGVLAPWVARGPLGGISCCFPLGGIAPDIPQHLNSRVVGIWWLTCTTRKTRRTCRRRP